MISVLALLLAVAELLGKSAQTDALNDNVEASNLWAFFQAKTIRKTTAETAAEQMKVDLELARDPAVRAILEKQIAVWTTRAARYESEPEMGKGRVARSCRRRPECCRPRARWAMAKYHNFEYSSAAFQIAIVLASSSRHRRRLSVVGRRRARA